MKKIKGQQLLINATGCNNEQINNEVIIRDFLDKLVKEIRMELLAPIKAYPAKAGEPDGVTGFAIITTSHISIHTFTDENMFWLDILSCKKFDEKKVIEIVKREFNCKVKIKSIKR